MMENPPALDLRRLQLEVTRWAERNFHRRESYQPLLGLMEEVGELAHAHLKEEQGIRGTPEELQAEARDAVGDIIIYLADYCNMRGWSMQVILEGVWKHVQQRDWTWEEGK